MPEKPAQTLPLTPKHDQFSVQEIVNGMLSELAGCVRYYAFSKRTELDQGHAREILHRIMSRERRDQGEIRGVAVKEIQRLNAVLDEVNERLGVLEPQIESLCNELTEARGEIARRQSVIEGIPIERDVAKRFERKRIVDLIEPKLNAVRACLGPLAWCIGPSPAELDDVDWDELKLHFCRDEIEDAQGAQRIVDEVIETVRNPDGMVERTVDVIEDAGDVPPREIPTSPDAAVAGLKTWHLSEGGVPRCNACGYSERDCALHVDHDRCPNPDPPAVEGDGA